MVAYGRWSPTGGGRIVAGVRCNVTGEYFEKGSTSEKKKFHWLPKISLRFLGSKPRIIRSLMPNKYPVMSTPGCPPDIWILACNENQNTCFLFWNTANRRHPKCLFWGGSQLKTYMYLDSTVLLLYSTAAS